MRRRLNPSSGPWRALISPLPLARPRRARRTRCLVFGGRAMSHAATCSEAEIVIVEIKGTVGGLACFCGLDGDHGIGIAEDVQRFHKGFEIGDGEGYDDGFVALRDDESFSRAAELGKTGLSFFHIVCIRHGFCIDDAVGVRKEEIGIAG